ncbi:MAG TPA: hemerythrin family protein [Gallionellaceae bacterium]|nr:hemerythrin family protein [Gallionellaceae bacterium]
MAGVIAIDKQHEKLVNMFNSLNEAVKNNESREDIYRIIDDVISYTYFHFEFEEQLMDQYGYPEIKAHKDKHKQLIQDALHLKEKLDFVGEHQFMEWFNHWPFANILAHIQYADKQIEDYIIQNGVKE